MTTDPLRSLTTVQHPLIDAIFQDAAEAGIIFFKPAGNLSYPISQTGSINDTFFDEDKYSEFLANNYITYAVDTTSGQGDLIFPSGSARYYNRPQPSNGSAIICGNGPNYQTEVGRMANVPEASASFPNLGIQGVYGPGVDAWSPGTGNTVAVGLNSTRANIHSHDGINTSSFDTQSVIDHWKTNYPDAWNVSDLTNHTTWSFSYWHGSSGSSSSTPRS